MYRCVNCLWVLMYYIAIPCMCIEQLEQGYSRIQYGYRLGSKTIDTYAQISFLDCVEECLVTTRCRSVNYYKGANYCETNYENKTSAEKQFMVKTGWVYSEKDDWPQDLAGPCASSNCDINQKCQYNKYSQENSFDCILSDCGIPQKYGVDVENVEQGEAIAINKGMHVRCSDGFEQFGSGRLLCRPNGEWDYKIMCVEKGWLQFNNGGHFYSIFTEMKNWTNAKADCESKEAYLVEIDSADENKWIKDNLLIQDITQDGCGSISNGQINDCRIWTGGYRERNEIGFRWTGSKQTLNYTNWKGSNPDNFENNEYCIQVYGSGEWNDLNCNHTHMYICEKNTN